MKLLARSCIPFLVAWAGTLATAQDDEGLDPDALFEEDFESEPAIAINDPLQPLNRAIFTFNDVLYEKAVKPFSRVYTRAMPDPVEHGVGNFFDNLKFPSRFAGSVLQGKYERAGKEIGKFVVNTTIGLGGFLKPSEDIEGLQPPKEDIGQAFAVWGFGHGFYLVMPFMGPTSLRDFTGDFADETAQPIPEPLSVIDDSSDRYALIGVEIVNDLPYFMDLYDSMKRSSIDPYSAVKDAFAQRRAAQVAE